MKELKGTKTEKNLQEAFAGESQARNKYTYFASKAKELSDNKPFRRKQIRKSSRFQFFQLILRGIFALSNENDKKIIV